MGIQSYSRGIVVGPFSDNPSCDVLANLTNNGMYFLGFPEGQHPVHYNVGTLKPLEAPFYTVQGLVQKGAGVLA